MYGFEASQGGMMRLARSYVYISKITNLMAGYDILETAGLGSK
jgi:hypothetical protein